MTDMEMFSRFAIVLCSSIHSPSYTALGSPKYRTSNLFRSIVSGSTRKIYRTLQ